MTNALLSVCDKNGFTWIKDLRQQPDSCATKTRAIIDKEHLLRTKDMKQVDINRLIIT